MDIKKQDFDKYSYRELVNTLNQLNTLNNQKSNQLAQLEQQLKSEKTELIHQVFETIHERNEVMDFKMNEYDKLIMN